MLNINSNTDEINKILKHMKEYLSQTDGINSVIVALQYKGTISPIQFSQCFGFEIVFMNIFLYIFRFSIAYIDFILTKSPIL